METLLYLSLGLNLILLWFIARKQTKKEKQTVPKQSPSEPQKPRPIVNAQLRTIAEACEAKLPEEDRGKVKLLVHEKKTEQVAILQIGELKISLCRDNKNQSLFKIHSFMEALKLANKGYEVNGLGTGRYIPVPQEVELILSQRHIINVYFEALGLEQISDEDDFWCVDTETGWNTGWKRFSWNVAIAFERLHRKSKIRTSDGEYLSQVEHEDKVNLFLLLKGWEYLFVEV